jgi:hypothetical protein
MSDKETIETEHPKRTHFAPPTETRESFIDKVVSEAFDDFCEKKCENRNDSTKCNGNELGNHNMLCYGLLLTELNGVRACVQLKVNEYYRKRYGFKL